MRTQGTRPDLDELEVSVFGRGIGEAILVHLGADRWFTVDSALCDAGDPVALMHLRAMGVDAAVAVKLVAVSHWDTDHIRGVAELFRACPSARFSCANTLQDPELVDHIELMGNPRARQPDRLNVDEFADVFAELDRRRRGVAWASEGKLLWEDEDARIWSLSPSDDTFARSLVRLLQNAQPNVDPRVDSRNALSVVLWIEAGPHRVLLGGDLDRAGRTGWSAVVESTGRRNQRATVFKAPHHGSKRGHSEAAWDRMLTRAPWVALTAFTPSHLPTPTDRRRIRARTAHAYLAGDKQVRPARDPDVENLVRNHTASGGLTPMTGPMGLVRLRRKLSKQSRWRVATLGNAGPL